MRSRRCIVRCARSSRPPPASRPDEAALKLMFLAIRNAGVHWRRPVEWTAAMGQFAIHFGARFPGTETGQGRRHDPGRMAGGLARQSEAAGCQQRLCPHRRLSGSIPFRTPVSALLSGKKSHPRLEDVGREIAYVTSLRMAHAIRPHAALFPMSPGCRPSLDPLSELEQ